MNWHYELNVKDLFQRDTDVDDSEIPGMAKEIVRRIKENRIYKYQQEAMDEFCSRLEAVDNTEDFDDVWEDLYDWADNHSLWIATF